MGTILKNTVVTEKKIIGLKDGGRVTLSCSACRNPLMTIWITRPDEKIDGKIVEWKVVAKCCYCKDSSYERVIKGGFHHSGFGLVNKHDSEMDTPVTVVEDIILEDDKVIFKIKKVENV